MDSLESKFVSAVHTSVICMVMSYTHSRAVTRIRRESDLETVMPRCENCARLKKVMKRQHPKTKSGKPQQKIQSRVSARQGSTLSTLVYGNLMTIRHSADGLRRVKERRRYTIVWSLQCFWRPHVSSMWWDTCLFVFDFFFFSDCSLGRWHCIAVHFVNSISNP